MPDSHWPPALEAALLGRYTLEQEFARGGMATVYRAQDVSSGRPVAVKVMLPSLATAIGRKRFEREIRVASSLVHPLIVPLLESGVAGELLFYVMPFIAGETLREQLSRERRLPCATAVAIGLDLASALGHAHGQGVLHRDVKPENVLLSDDRAFVADFGLARAVRAADSTQLTATGTMVGTIEYMSPEQVLEEDDLDERTDVYGLGCVLFESLTGEPPFSGSSLHELVKRILKTPAARVRGFRVDVPTHIDDAITRALAKDPSERHGTMAELSRALRDPG